MIYFQLPVEVIKLKDKILIMGRTIVPHRWIFEQEKGEWYKRLKPTTKLQLAQELFNGAAYYNDAGSNWGTGQVRDKVLFLVLFSQYKEIKKLEKKNRSN